jgi:hypothetical protein
LRRTGERSRGESRGERRAAEEALNLPPGWGIDSVHRARWDNDAAVQSAIAKWQAACDAEGLALNALMANRPTTQAGLRALTEYAREWADGDLHGTAPIRGCEDYAWRILTVLAGMPDPDPFDPDFLFDDEKDDEATTEGEHAGEGPRPEASTRVECGSQVWFITPGTVFEAA